MENSTPFQPWTTEDSSKNAKTERELVDDAKLHRENVNHPKHRQTASYDKESVVAPSAVPGPSTAAGAGISPVGGNVSKMDSSKISSMQQIVENTLSQEGRQRVSQLLEAVEALSGAERLLLYLRLPTGVPPHDPLKQPINPLGSRAELQQTVTWIQTHLEVDPDVSLPKQDVYDEYIAHCMSSNMKPLSTADFGKVMKQVYPTVRPRRLGTRGNSRYCYAGLRKKVKLEVPQLPDLNETSKEPSGIMKESERIVCDWAESKFASLDQPTSPISCSSSSLGTVDTETLVLNIQNHDDVMTCPASVESEQSEENINSNETPVRPLKRSLIDQLERNIEGEESNTSLRSKKHPALSIPKPKKPFEKVAESKLEIIELQKTILKEELINNRLKFSFEEKKREQQQKEWEEQKKRWNFEEEERHHRREIWALEKELMIKKLKE